MAIKPSKPINNFLSDFGLTDKEITLYMTLLKTGPNTIMNLSREAGIKRSTTHNNVEELIKKGLVSQTNYGERRMVVAEDPVKLEFLLEQKRWTMKKMEDSMSDVVKMIKDSVPTDLDKEGVNVKYYEGDEGVKYTYDQILKAKSVYAFINVDKFKATYPEYIGYFAEEFKKREDLNMWDILEHHTRTSSDEDSYDSNRYHYKYVPSGTTLNDTDITIFDDKIALIKIDKENPSSIIITSKPLSIAFQNIHKMVWNVLS